MRVQKREWTDAAGKHRQAWRVRWQDGDRWQSRTFPKKADADAFDAELVGRRRLGQLAHLDAGTQTLNEYMRDVWIPTYFSVLARKTQVGYQSLYATHLRDEFGGTPLRDISSETIGAGRARRSRREKVKWPCARH